MDIISPLIEKTVDKFVDNHSTEGELDPMKIIDSGVKLGTMATEKVKKTLDSVLPALDKLLPPPAKREDYPTVTAVDEFLDKTFNHIGNVFDADPSGMWDAVKKTQSRIDKIDSKSEQAIRNFAPIFMKEAVDTYIKDVTGHSTLELSDKIVPYFREGIADVAGPVAAYAFTAPYEITSGIQKEFFEDY